MLLRKRTGGKKASHFLGTSGALFSDSMLRPMRKELPRTTTGERGGGTVM